MEKEDFIYQPHKSFEEDFKHQYHDTAVDYFNSLVEKTETDSDANRVHVEEYRVAAAELEAAKKKWNSLKGLRGMFIAFTILGFLAGIICFVLFALNTAMWGFIIGGVAGILLGGFSIWGIVNFNKKAKNQEAVIAPLQQKADEKLSICYADMAKLNGEFDWNMAAIIMEKATPNIDLDPYFSNKTLTYLIDHFGFPEAEDENTSVLGLVSGHIQGNPFVLEKIFRMNMGMKTYTGSITITWTEYVGSGKDRHLVTRSQTLTASIEKECPFYNAETRLIFGSEAAPNLSFSRRPYGADKMDAKQREKAWRSGGKDLDKLQTKASKKGGGFTKMNNDEFEVFWGATDRDNEVEFRYLFSPLAQVSILELIENPEPFGDDFYFVKDKMLTSIASAHSQKFNYTPAPSYFYHYSLEDCRENFISYCDAFIKNLYFDLAPILAIPAYQSDTTRDYIYHEILPGNYNCYEHEVFANGLETDIFRPEDSSSDVPLILKAGRASKQGKTDVLPVTAYSFRKETRVEYVTRFGGDGRSHSIPVYWDEYIPVSRVSEMALTNVEASQKRYRGALGVLDEYLKKTGYAKYFERGFLALALRKGHIESGVDEKLESIFNPEE